MPYRLIVCPHPLIAIMSKTALLKPTPFLKDIKQQPEGSKTLGRNKSEAALKLPEGRNKLPRNVNEYKHLMHGSMTSEASLEWVLELRAQDSAIKAKMHSPSGAPSFVKREVTNQHCAVPDHSQGPHVLLVDTESVRKRSSDVQHLARHRLGVPANGSQLAFESSLRPEVSAASRPKWTSLPFKARNGDTDIPRFFPPLSTIAANEVLKRSHSSGLLYKGAGIPMETVFEGMHKAYPELKDAESYKRTCLHRHLFTPGKMVSTLNWEVGLRSYKAKP